jgi:hypothetical protein
MFPKKGRVARQQPKCWMKQKQPMVLLNKLNNANDNIASGSAPYGYTFSDEGTMKEPLVIEFGIPMVTGSSGAHETTISTQQMPIDTIGKSFDNHIWYHIFQLLIQDQIRNFFSFQTLVCTHLYLCCVLFGTL